jgi:transposase
MQFCLWPAEHGCKWRGLPKRFGNWHTIYTCMNRWAKASVLDRLFEQLQNQQLVRIRIEAVKLDSTTVKVHPDGTGALKKTDRKPRKIPRRMDHQDSYGCRGCSNRHRALPDSRASSRRACWARVAANLAAVAQALSPFDGSRVQGQ